MRLEGDRSPGAFKCQSTELRQGPGSNKEPWKDLEHSSRDEG